jgi:hypothetical protein
LWLPGGTEKNQEEPQPGKLAWGSVLKPGIFHTSVQALNRAVLPQLILNAEARHELYDVTTLAPRGDHVTF